MTEQAIVEQVKAACSAGTTLALHGGKTKAFYGNPMQADAELDCSSHRGVIAYEPTELAITVRAGTPLSAVEALLAEHGQEFPFEPPHFGDRATIGGMVAAGLSGPRRPYAASVRDAVLGVRMLNGKGEVLDFGGRVMKNVAGYDLSRLMVGSLGVLGVLLEVSIKVMPRAPGRITLVQEQDQASALALMQRWAGQALPITGTAWLNGRLHVRVAGSEEALSETQRMLGGALMEPEDADAFWTAVREQQLECFAGELPLWRISVPPATAADAIPDVDLIEWGGALRWLRRETLFDDEGLGDARTGAEHSGAARGVIGADRGYEIGSGASAAAVRAWAAAAGGHATLFRAGLNAGSSTEASAGSSTETGPGTTAEAPPGASARLPSKGVFAPLSPVALRLHQNLKQAFDPAGIFNPGRLYR
ncbi:MAG: glycolate oxidase subunit GlcE [Lamprobacter sp.]|uniref:glycolate oxidase subunit GlcE n=1 Tax=Lamprobacter sp. TaxID=3100796 RepID=UPI002B25B3D9|nr:glycolate oxidase subunit GlcE [Lamprobacter sp.]MEA3642734.1 glycolate oxidase subunit GlcE [Lamprobacter sp.]